MLPTGWSSQKSVRRLGRQSHPGILFQPLPAHRPSPCPWPVLHIGVPLRGLLSFLPHPGLPQKPGVWGRGAGSASESGPPQASGGLGWPTRLPRAAHRTRPHPSQPSQVHGSCLPGTPLKKRTNKTKSPQTDDTTKEHTRAHCLVPGAGRRGGCPGTAEGGAPTLAHWILRGPGPRALAPAAPHLHPRASRKQQGGRRLATGPGRLRQGLPQTSPSTRGAHASAACPGRGAAPRLASPIPKTDTRKKTQAHAAGRRAHWPRPPPPRPAPGATPARPRGQARTEPHGARAPGRPAARRPLPAPPRPGARSLHAGPGRRCRSGGGHRGRRGLGRGRGARTGQANWKGMTTRPGSWLPPARARARARSPAAPAGGR